MSTALARMASRVRRARGWRRGASCLREERAAEGMKDCNTGKTNSTNVRIWSYARRQSRWAMGIRFFSRLRAPFALLFLIEIAPCAARAQEIPLERCDKLPVIEVAVGGQSKLFLVDTAATSFLNLQSFAEGKTHDVQVTSWAGTTGTSAQQVSLTAIEVGSTKLAG